jgi:GST-like protein
MSDNLHLVTLGVAAVAGAVLFVIGHRRGRSTAPGMSTGGSKFASINRPTSGARFERSLPRGSHRLQLYSCATPNGQKVTILLEELGVAYDAHYVDIGTGDQFGSGFVALNPNSKIPALDDTGRGLAVFESTAIMMYLCEAFPERAGDLLPSDPAQRAECLSWLFFQHGAAPFFGQFGHFWVYAPGAKTGGRIPYAVDRYTMETQRLCSVIEGRLTDGRPYLLGAELSLADLALMPWIQCLEVYYGARGEPLRMDPNYPLLLEWVARLLARPAVERGMRVNGFMPELRNYSTEGIASTTAAKSK